MTELRIETRLVGTTLHWHSLRQQGSSVLSWAELFARWRSDAAFGQAWVLALRSVAFTAGAREWQQCRARLSRGTFDTFATLNARCTVH